MTLPQVGIVVFAAGFVLALGVFLFAQDRLSRKNRKLRRRMRHVLEGGTQAEETGYLLLRDESISHIPFLNRLLSRLRFARHLQQRIDEAGLSLKAGTLILGMLSLSGLTWLLLDSYMPIRVLAPIPAVVAGMIPYFWVMKRRRARIDRFEELLPEAIDLVVNALRSGFSLEASLSLVAEEIPDPLGTEFAITFEEQNLGLDLLAALVNMTMRMPSDDLRILTTAISIQKKSGGNLTEILGKISDMVRERLQLRREVRIFTAQGRFSGAVLAAMPIAMILVLAVLSPEYIKILFVDPFGHILLGAAAFLQILGFLVIRRIVQLRY